jgi:predicted dehydrogenase
VTRDPAANPQARPEISNEGTDTPEIGVGVIGCGYWGPNLVRNFARQEGCRVRAVCDLTAERAQRVAREFHILDVTADPASVIQNPEVQLVVVATPTATHYHLARRAITAGKHVLVMKPLTAVLEQAEELVDLAERQGVVLAVDHTFVYTGAVQRIRELVARGELGEIYYLDSVRINLGLFQSDVNVMWDLAPHDVSIIDYVLGGPEPTEVSAVGACHAGSRMENIAYLTIRYGPQLLAHVHVNWLAPAKVRRTIVGGSRRMVVYDDMEPSEKIRVYDTGVLITPRTTADEVYSQLVSYRTGDMHAPRVDTREALAVEAEHVLQCIRTGTRPRSDGHAGVRVVRILQAAQDSIRNGSRAVTFGPDALNRAQGRPAQ